MRQQLCTSAALQWCHWIWAGWEQWVQSCIWEM